MANIPPDQSEARCIPTQRAPNADDESNYQFAITNQE